MRLGSLYSALAFMFLPVTLLGVYSPFAIRLVLRATRHSGTVSGTVYGVSTAGSIVGTLGTTFFLIPMIGTRMITLLLGAAGICCGLFLIALDRVHWPGKGAQSAVKLIAFAVLMLACNHAWSDGPFDENVRAQMLKHSDGRVAHCPSSNALGQTAAFGTEALARLGLRLGSFQPMLQSSQFDGVAFDPFSLQKDGLASAEVDVGRR